MEKGIELYGLVYDYYETRIRFGYYRYGERLPSIWQISENFHLGRTTVRRAMNKLEKKGYIRLEERRLAWVSFQEKQEKFRENAALYYGTRKEGLLEFNCSGRLLLQPLWEAGIRNLDQKSKQKICYCLKSAALSDVPVFLEIWLIVLGTLNNGLILNLYWERIRYIRFPYLVKEFFITEQELEEKKNNELFAFLNQKIVQSNAGIEYKLYGFIEEACREYGLEDTEQVPFQWNIYRKRPQLKYTMASAVIREIMRGSYPAGSYLPSLSRLTGQYGVSLATARRTMTLLENMGLTRAHQGKGTQVWPIAGKINLSLPEVQEGFRLYRESLQLLSLTIRQTSLYTLCSAKEERRTVLLEQLAQLSFQKNCFYGLEIFLTFIGEECPLAMVRECYGRLRELIVLGYPLILLYISNGCLDNASDISERIEDRLRVGDIKGFSLEWEHLVHLFYRQEQGI